MSTEPCFWFLIENDETVYNSSGISFFEDTDYLIDKDYWQEYILQDTPLNVTEIETICDENNSEIILYVNIHFDKRVCFIRHENGPEYSVSTNCYMANYQLDTREFSVIFTICVYVPGYYSDYQNKFVVDTTEECTGVFDNSAVSYESDLTKLNEIIEYGLVYYWHMSYYYNVLYVIINGERKYVWLPFGIFNKFQYAKNLEFELRNLGINVDIYVCGSIIFINSETSIEFEIENFYDDRPENHFNKKIPCGINSKTFTVDISGGHNSYLLLMERETKEIYIYHFSTTNSTQLNGFPRNIPVLFANNFTGYPIKYRKGIDLNNLTIDDIDISENHLKPLFIGNEIINDTKVDYIVRFNKEVRPIYSFCKSNEYNELIFDNEYYCKGVCFDVAQHNVLNFEYYDYLINSEDYSNFSDTVMFLKHTNTYDTYIDNSATNNNTIVIETYNENIDRIRNQRIYSKFMEDNNIFQLVNSENTYTCKLPIGIYNKYQFIYALGNVIRKTLGTNVNYSVNNCEFTIQSDKEFQIISENIQSIFFKNSEMNTEFSWTIDGEFNCYAAYIIDNVFGYHKIIEFSEFDLNTNLLENFSEANEIISIENSTIQFTKPIKFMNSNSIEKEYECYGKSLEYSNLFSNLLRNDKESTTIEIKNNYCQKLKVNSNEMLKHNEFDYSNYTYFILKCSGESINVTINSETKSMNLPHGYYAFYHFIDMLNSLIIHNFPELKSTGFVIRPINKLIIKCENAPSNFKIIFNDFNSVLLSTMNNVVISSNLIRPADIVFSNNSYYLLGVRHDVSSFCYSKLYDIPFNSEYTAINISQCVNKLYSGSELTELSVTEDKITFSTKHPITLIYSMFYDIDFKELLTMQERIDFIAKYFKESVLCKGIEYSENYRNIELKCPSDILTVTPNKNRYTFYNKRLSVANDHIFFDNTTQLIQVNWITESIFEYNNELYFYVKNNDTYINFKYETTDIITNTLNNGVYTFKDFGYTLLRKLNEYYPKQKYVDWFTEKLDFGLSRFVYGKQNKWIYDYGRDYSSSEDIHTSITGSSSNLNFIFDNYNGESAFNHTFILSPIFYSITDSTNILVNNLTIDNTFVKAEKYSDYLSQKLQENSIEFSEFNGQLFWKDMFTSTLPHDYYLTIGINSETIDIAPELISKSTKDTDSLIINCSGGGVPIQSKNNENFMITFSDYDISFIDLFTEYYKEIKSCEFNEANELIVENDCYLTKDFTNSTVNFTVNNDNYQFNFPKKCKLNKVGYKNILAKVIELYSGVSVNFLDHGLYYTIDSDNNEIIINSEINKVTLFNESGYYHFFLTETNEIKKYPITNEIDDIYKELSTELIYENSGIDTIQMIDNHDYVIYRIKSNEPMIPIYSNTYDVTKMSELFTRDTIEKDVGYVSRYIVALKYPDTSNKFLEFIDYYSGNILLINSHLISSNNCYFYNESTPADFIYDNRHYTIISESLGNNLFEFKGREYAYTTRNIRSGVYTKEQLFNQLIRQHLGIQWELSNKLTSNFTIKFICKYCLISLGSNSKDDFYMCITKNSDLSCMTKSLTSKGIARNWEYKLFDGYKTTMISLRTMGSRYYSYILTEKIADNNLLLFNECFLGDFIVFNGFINDNENITATEIIETEDYYQITMNTPVIITESMRTENKIQTNSLINSEIPDTRYIRRSIDYTDIFSNTTIRKLDYSYKSIYFNTTIKFYKDHIIGFRNNEYEYVPFYNKLTKEILYFSDKGPVIIQDDYNFIIDNVNYYRFTESNYLQCNGSSGMFKCGVLSLHDSIENIMSAINTVIGVSVNYGIFTNNFAVEISVNTDEIFYDITINYINENKDYWGIVYYHNNLKNIMNLFEELFQKQNNTKQKQLNFKVKRTIPLEYKLLAEISKNNQIIYSSDYYYKIKGNKTSSSILGNKFRTY